MNKIVEKKPLIQIETYNFLLTNKKQQKKRIKELNKKKLKQHYSYSGNGINKKNKIAQVLKKYRDNF
tara:strand:+ start:268 stop:468 length:201 start_codon:yes stop_codon:yes gene_type:complete